MILDLYLLLLLISLNLQAPVLVQLCIELLLNLQNKLDNLCRLL